MDPRVRRRRLVIIFGSFAAAPVLAALVYFLVPATSFSPEALHHSVAWEADSSIFGSAGCDRHVKGGWSCAVTDRSGSGSVDYRVEMDGSRCWHGERRGRPGGEHSLPKSIDGCLKVGDQIRPWDRFWEWDLGEVD
jgi:hypothetical protein